MKSENNALNIVKKLRISVKLCADIFLLGIENTVNSVQLCQV